MPFRPLLVREVAPETTSARSFRLEPRPEDQDHFRYRAGQCLPLRLEVGGSSLLRSYSLSSAPETDPLLTITVQQVEGGRISKWFNEEVAPGDVLEADRPTGRFVLNGSARPLLLFAAGSGISPVYSLLKSAIATSFRPIHLLYANRHPDRAIFKDAIDRLAREHADRFVCQHHFDADRGFITAEEIRDVLLRAPDAEVYVCGPEPFISLVQHEAGGAGIPADRVITEDFDSSMPPSS